MKIREHLFKFLFTDELKAFPTAIFCLLVGPVALAYYFCIWKKGKYEIITLSIALQVILVVVTAVTSSEKLKAFQIMRFSLIRSLLFVFVTVQLILLISDRNEAPRVLGVAIVLMNIHFCYLGIVFGSLAVRFLSRGASH
ncbi:MAG: hypothetical protein O9342_04780 [Beijerinckiaceae bacterium]|nr:hypothetical protein [Beijerinckiaceae bacterium]